MKSLLATLLLASTVTTSASADPWKNESGKSRERGYYRYEDRYSGYDADRYRRVRTDTKEKYWDGRCEVERKWNKNGGYEEKRKCR